MKKAAAKRAGNGAKHGNANARREMTIEEKIRALVSKVPRSELRKLPTDLSANHDHYLYGWPKRY